MSTLKEKREEWKTKTAKLAVVFEEAKTDDGQIDFNKVTCLGKDVKGSIAVAEKVKAMDDELNKIGEELDVLQAAEKAASDNAAREKAYEDREKTVDRPRVPGTSDPSQPHRPSKGLGTMVSEHKDFQEFAKRGDRGGLTLAFDDVWPSDVLAKGRDYNTFGQKTLFETGAGYAPESVRLPGIVEAVTRPIQLIDIIPLGQTSQEAIKYMEETTRTHGAAETAEGGDYAESTFVFTEKSSTVEKITDSIPVTDEQLEDVAMAASYLNGRIIFGLRQRFDSQALIGNGTPPNLRGLKNTVGIQVQAKGADPVPDAFYKAMTKIMVTGRAMPTHHVIHPTDWQDIRLLRTADGIYIWGNPSEAGPERLWGLPVVKCDADSAGTGYVGSFQPGHVSAFERRGVDVQVGYVGSQFTKGLRTIRGDMRAALVFFRPAAFCSVTGI